jgi:hypothetical protein
MPLPLVASYWPSDSSPGTRGGTAEGSRTTGTRRRFVAFRSGQKAHTAPAVVGSMPARHKSPSLLLLFFFSDKTSKSLFPNQIVLNYTRSLVCYN